MVFRTRPSLRTLVVGRVLNIASSLDFFTERVSKDDRTQQERVLIAVTHIWDAFQYQGNYNGTRSGSGVTVPERVLLLEARKRDAFSFRDLLF